MRADANRRLAFVLTIAIVCAAACGCGHNSSPTGCDICLFTGRFADTVPSNLSPGETGTFHFQVTILEAIHGPVSGSFLIFPDKNLEYLGVIGRSGSGAVIPLGFTDFPDFDQTGWGFESFGPASPGQSVYLDLRFRLTDQPVHYQEPSGFFSAHVGVVLTPDVGTGYNTGIATDEWVHITTQN